MIVRQTGQIRLDQLLAAFDSMMQKMLAAGEV
jgi:hypothetical protein